MIRPQKILLDVSTACQLNCPGCPTASGIISNHIGTGFLSFETFREFIHNNPTISSIGLSNWGEIFLNPELDKIIRYAYEHTIALDAYNGANLNHATDDILESLVKYKFRGLTCSIDGASRSTYPLYRIGGDFDRVIGNIKKINTFKLKHGSLFPRLIWQFVPFGHNEHEISKARAMAGQLNMDFYLKISWDDFFGVTFSEVKDKQQLRRETNHGTADRKEYRLKYGKSFNASICHQLWLTPQINYDGKLLGCCNNYWQDYGNVFTEGLENCLNSPRMQTTRSMLLGKIPASPDSPCLNCHLYKDMKARTTWINPKEIRHYSHRLKHGRSLNWLINKLDRPIIHWLVKPMKKTLLRYTSPFS